MALGTRWAAFLRTLFRGARADRGLDAEVGGYVEHLADEKMRAGLGPGEARRQALLEVGGIEPLKERVRDVRTGAGFETAVRDLRYGLRTLARTPGLSAAMVLVLALGIAASTAVFSVVNAVLLRPLPYEAADRLVVMLHRDRNPVAPANYLDWRRAATRFERMGAAELWSPNLTGDDHPERVRALRVTADILPLLGVAPAVGRPLLERDFRAGTDKSLVLGHELWQSRYAGDPGVVGRAITLDGEAYTVVGVMPAGFSFPPFWATGSQLWAPLLLEDRATNREGSSLRVFGRLAEGVTLEEARAEVAAITARLEAEFPGTNNGVTVRPLIDVVVGDVRPALLVLLGAVGFVLLVTCANVAHMLLARAAARQKEIALRAALGASRGRLLRQLLTESLVLALAAGGAGLLLARGGIRALVALGPPGLPRLETVVLDGRVLAFALAVSLATGFAFGLVPALQATRRDLGDSLREGERGSTEGGGRGGLRSVLVASEMALALVLLVGAGLMIRSFVALQAVDPGFDRRNVLSMIVSVAGTASAEPARRAAFFEGVVRDASALPGVTGASAINHLPLAGDIWGWPFRVEEGPEPKPGESPTATYRVVLPGYFRTMGIPVRRGRDVQDGDRAGAPGVVVVNESLAARHWPGEDPIGKRLALSDGEAAPTWLTVVGVVKDTVRGRWGAPPEDELFLPYPQVRRYVENPSSHYAYLTLVVRTTGDPASLAPALRRAVWARERNAPISDVRVLEEVVEGATARPRFYVVLLGSFAAVALFLAAVGVYAVISFSVARRTNEIGIRMALGAEPGDVVRLVVGQGLLVGLVGALAGVLGALALTRLMSTMLYGVGSHDPATFACVLVLLATVALLASYIPARRATRIDPLRALRYE
jgi:putative ABC transport system permease protein